MFVRENIGCAGPLCFCDRAPLPPPDPRPPESALGVAAFFLRLRFAFGLALATLRFFFGAGLTSSSSLSRIVPPFRPRACRIYRCVGLRGAAKAQRNEAQRILFDAVTDLLRDTETPLTMHTVSPTSIGNISSLGWAPFWPAAGPRRESAAPRRASGRGPLRIRHFRSVARISPIRHCAATKLDRLGSVRSDELCERSAAAGRTSAAWCAGPPRSADWR